MIVPYSNFVIVAVNDKNNVWGSTPTKSVQETRRTKGSSIKKFVYFDVDRRQGEGALYYELSGSVCKFCNEEIFWKQSKRTGRWYAVNNENDHTLFHSETCDRED